MRKTRVRSCARMYDLVQDPFCSSIKVPLEKRSGLSILNFPTESQAGRKPYTKRTENEVFGTCSAHLDFRFGRRNPRRRLPNLGGLRDRYKAPILKLKVLLLFSNVSFKGNFRTTPLTRRAASPSARRTKTSSTLTTTTTETSTYSRSERPGSPSVRTKKK